MTTTSLMLNLGLLGWVLRNLGTTTVTRSTFLVPLLIIGVAGAIFVADIPTAGNDIPLDALGVTTAAVLGIAATRLTRIRRTGSEVVITAGAGFATLWTTVIGGRMLSRSGPPDRAAA